MLVSKETNGSMYWQMRDRSLELCFKTKLTTVNTSDIYTRARTRLLPECQEKWNEKMEYPRVSSDPLDTGTQNLRPDLHTILCDKVTKVNNHKESPAHEDY
jgi:hypothetical protein